MHPGFGTHLLGEDSSTLSLPSGSGGLISEKFSFFQYSTTSAHEINDQHSTFHS